MKRRHAFYGIALLMTLSCTQTAKVKFITQPSNATISLNGLPLCPNTPCETELPRGEHVITVQREDYQPVEHLLTLKKDNVVRLDLKPNGGWLNIVSTPPELMISINHKMVGMTPIKQQLIKQGTHSIRIHNSCFEPLRKEINVQNGNTHTINLNARPYFVEATITVMDVDQKEVAANIFIDGVAYGQSPKSIPIPKCSQTIYAQSKNQHGHVILEQTNKKNEIAIQISTTQAAQPLEQLLGYTPPECRKNNEADQQCIKNWLQQKQMEIEEQDAHLHHDGCKH